MKKIFFLLTLIITLVSCRDIVESITNSNNNTIVKENEKTYGKNFKIIKVDSLFQISLPKYMKELKNLNPDAIVQYANIYKEIYTVIIVENKNSFVDLIKEYDEYDNESTIVENYSEVQLNTTKELMKVHSIKKTNVKNIDDLDARQFIIKGAIDNINIAYQFTFVESENDIYQIINWTLKDRFNRFEGTFKYINNSFFKTEQLYN